MGIFRNLFNNIYHCNFHSCGFYQNKSIYSWTNSNRWDYRYGYPFKSLKLFSRPFTKQINKGAVVNVFQKDSFDKTTTIELLLESFAIKHRLSKLTQEIDVTLDKRNKRKFKKLCKEQEKLIEKLEAINQTLGLEDSQ